jgi:hypothetical protein
MKNGEHHCAWTYCGFALGGKLVLRRHVPFLLVIAFAAELTVEDIQQ